MAHNHFYTYPAQNYRKSFVKIFELADEITIHSIEEAVRRVITNFEPRVRILDIDSQFFEDENAYRLTLEFQILSTEQVATTTIVLERIR